MKPFTQLTIPKNAIWRARISGHDFSIIGVYTETRVIFIGGSVKGTSYAELANWAQYSFDGGHTWHDAHEADAPAPAAQDRPPSLRLAVEILDALVEMQIEVEVRAKNGAPLRGRLTKLVDAIYRLNDSNCQMMIFEAKRFKKIMIPQPIHTYAIIVLDYTP